MNRWQRPPVSVRTGPISNTKRYLVRVSQIFKNKTIASKCMVEMLGPLNSKKLDTDNILYGSINLRNKNITCDGKPVLGGIVSVWTWNEGDVEKLHVKVYKD